MKNKLFVIGILMLSIACVKNNPKASPTIVEQGKADLKDSFMNTETSVSQNINEKYEQEPVFKAEGKCAHWVYKINVFDLSLKNPAMPI